MTRVQRVRSATLLLVLLSISLVSLVRSIAIAERTVLLFRFGKQALGPDAVRVAKYNRHEWFLSDGSRLGEPYVGSASGVGTVLIVISFGTMVAAGQGLQRVFARRVDVASLPAGSDGA